MTFALTANIRLGLKGANVYLIGPCLTYIQKNFQNLFYNFFISPSLSYLLGCPVMPLIKGDEIAP